ncbi:TPA: polysaccharide permease [Candidatus Saccharibacteria bacterium]|nr:polysaccharide permease [Candidatus Saccharibacteria bacterium]
MFANSYKKYRYSLILLRELVVTEFKLRYQGSVLGYLWSLLKPLFLFAILYFVFVYFLKIGDNVPHWPIAMLLGIVLWNFFAEVTNNGLNAIVARGDVIRKINFPKYVIILASSVSALINLLLNFVIVAVFMLVNGVDISWVALLAPIYILELFAFGLGLAFLLSAVQVRFRDVGYIWEIIMQALFYGSAVIYPLAMVLEQSQKLGTVLLFNPIAQAIQDTRHVLVSEANPTLYSLTGSVWLSLIPVVFVVLVVIFGAWYFKRKSPYFAEEV